MKHFLITIVFLTLTFHWAYGQVALKNENQIAGYYDIPQERIYAHLNTSLFLTGEYLYYTIYCFNIKTDELSELSKIGYVELISDKGEQMFKQKVNLDRGLGNGDFFIPVTAQTGSYKLLVYTNWMKNSGVDQFFQADIHIINPYQTTTTKNQTALSKPIDSSAISTDEYKSPIQIYKNTGPLELALSLQTVKTRSKVSLDLKSKDATSTSSGDYSISIRKKTTLAEPSKSTLLSQFQNFEMKNADDLGSAKTQIYLPELRGELLRGKVSTSTNNTIHNLHIAASIPGDNFFIAIAQTNSKGEFYLNIDKDYEGDRIYIEILNKPPQDYKIVIQESNSLDYSAIHFKKLKLDSTMKKEILQRSIHNQIDNAYFKYKPDSIIESQAAQLFDDKKMYRYKLDDFTRFKTVRETIFEIVKDVTIANMNKTTSFMRVQGYDYGTNSGVLPLVLIDGLQINDHTLLLARNAFTIDEVTVFRDRFVLGPKVYQGALLFTTKNNNIEEFQNAASYSSFNLLKPQVNKNYFMQRYDGNAASRIPDDRIQLLWIPHVKVSDKTATIEFYTSDVAGEFEIRIEGFTAKNEPVSLVSHFSVEPD